MKKLALALVAATTFAGTAFADINTGFYLGAGLGSNSVTAPFSGSTTQTFNAQGVRITPTGKISGDMGRNRLEGSFYGGYGYVTGCTYVGGEAGYTITAGKAGSKVAASLRVGAQTFNQMASIDIERRHIFNAAFIWGQKFNPTTMIYGRLGLNSVLLKETISSTGITTINNKKRKFSFAPGVGLESAVTKNVRVRVQWVYDVGSSVPGTGKVKSQSTTFGIAYKF